jgi:hypothetical protein
VHHSLLQNIDGMSFNNQKGAKQCIALPFFFSNLETEW